MAGGERRITVAFVRDQRIAHRLGTDTAVAKLSLKLRVGLSLSVQQRMNIIDEMRKQDFDGLSPTGSLVVLIRDPTGQRIQPPLNTDSSPSEGSFGLPS